VPIGGLCIILSAPSMVLGYVTFIAWTSLVVPTVSFSATFSGNAAAVRSRLLVPCMDERTNKWSEVQRKKKEAERAYLACSSHGAR
jgi:hypothetical protein